MVILSLSVKHLTFYRGDELSGVMGEERALGLLPLKTREEKRPKEASPGNKPNR